MSENIYDILSKLNGAMGKMPSSTVEADPIVESIDPDDLSDAVSLLEKKFSKFNPGDETEGNWLNPKAKRTVQLAKAKYPETASDLEAVVAAMGDKTEELDQRDRETGEWMNKAKSTIDSQQKEIKRTEQAIVAANARYDAQEKRFQDFTQQVAAANLPVQQQAQAAVDFAKATKDSGAAPEKIAAQGKEIVAKAKEKAKEKEQPTATASIPQRPSADIYQFPDKEQPADNQQTTNTNQSAKKPSNKVTSIDTAKKKQKAPGIDDLKIAAESLTEESRYPEGTPEAGKYNWGLLARAWKNKLPYVDLDFGLKDVRMTDAQMYAALATWKSNGVDFSAGGDPTIDNVLSSRENLELFFRGRKFKEFLSAYPKVKEKALKATQGAKPGITARVNTNVPAGTQEDLPLAEQNLGNPSMKNLEQVAESLMEKYMGFKKTVAAIKKGGSAENPEAVAAAIGRKKYGKKAFQKAAATGKKLGEAAKPDFLDLDKDGDTDEPMKSAAKSAKKHEPAEVDKDAVAKRKRLQALKDKQEDERAEKGDDDKSSSRFVKGRAYGGSAQKDDKEDDDLEESGLQAYLGKKKYGKEGMKALQQAGREGAGKEKMAVLRAKHDKMDEARPSRADKVTKDLTSIADKKGYKSAKDFTKADWNKVAKPHGYTGKEIAAVRGQKLKESRNAESSEYTYETIGRVLCDEQPHLDANSEAFVKAVYDELIEMKLTPKAARWLVNYDQDFLSDCATSYGHFCASKEKEAMECGAPMNAFVSEQPTIDAVQELDEIAKLAGLAREDFNPMAPGDSASPLTYAGCSKCNADPCCCEDEKAMDEGMGCSEEELNEAATRKDFRMVADLLKSIPDMAKRTELAMYHADIFKQQNPRFKKEMFLAAAGVDTTPIKDAKDEVLVSEEEVGEGNEFSGALAKARADGKKEFEVDGKKYTVKEDININVSANGEEDVVNLIRKLSGMPVVAIQAQPAMAEEVVAEEGPTERDVEYANTPHEDVAGTDAAIPAGGDLNRAKKQYRKEYPGDNPMAVAEAKEESLWRAYESMINDVKA